MLRTGVLLSLMLIETTVASPTTGPSSPAEQSNLSDPYSALFSFSKALEGGDIEQLKAVTVGSTADYTRIEPMLKVGAAARRLEDAACAYFGDEARHTVELPSETYSPRVYCKEAASGGYTTLHGFDESRLVQLLKVGDQWKVIVSTALPIGTPGELSRLDHVQLDRAGVYDDLTAKVKSGEFKNPHQLRQALANAESKLPSTTQPARARSH